MVTIISGYFNPLHVGHLEYIKKAKQLNDGPLIVIVNNDHQAKLKNGKSFMKDTERIQIIESIKGVDEVVLSIDYNRSVKKTINRIYERFKGFNIIFCNGGDQPNETCLEKEICEILGIKMVDNLGEKIQSSKWLLKKN